MLGDFSSRQANPGVEVSVKPRMAHGECNVTVDTIVKIAIGLGISAGELFARARL